MNGIILGILLILIIGFIIYLHIQIVPKTKMYVVERLGQFHKVHQACIFFQIPFVEKVKIKLNSQTNYLTIEPIEVETNDNTKKVITFNNIGYTINDVQKLIYNHSDYNKELLSIIYNITTNSFKNYSSQEIKSYQADIEKTIKDTLNIKVKSFGIQITSTKFKI